MTEVLMGRDPSMEMPAREVSSSSVRSGPPRYEAFLMTGEKMLSLDHKISPRYAEIYGEQLPPSVAVGETPARRGAFDDYPSQQQKVRPRRFNTESAVPASQSENGLNAHSPNTAACAALVEEQQSSVTVNVDAVIAEAGDMRGSDQTVSSSAVSSQFSLTSTTRSPAIDRKININQTSSSEPSSPAKGALPITNNFVSTVTCPSPPHESDRKSEVDSEASSRLAKRLYALDGFRKSDVATHLSKTNDFGVAVADEYCALFNFLGVRLDVAIRDFLSRFCLTGESQERARIIEHFAKRYHQCNPTLFDSSDQVHALTCALLLLNSDLHGPNVGRRMSSREFIDNISQTEHNFDRSLLKTLYGSIKDQPIKWAEEDDKAEQNGELPADGSTSATSADKKKRKPLSKPKSAIGGDDQIEYKAGWVVRKCVYDRDGNRTPFGRRGWRMLYARVRGMVMYLHKDENGFRRGRYETFNNAILLHHSFAERPRDYKKRQHVFRLRTANLGEFLFQTSDPNEVQRWIDTINYVAAAFSSPAMPAPVSSEAGVFHKPLLPSAPSRLTIPEQLRAHEEKELEMRQRLEELMREGPPLNTKGPAVYDFFFKERYLYQERERYELYVSVLRARLNAISPANSMAIRVDSSGGVDGNVSASAVRAGGEVTARCITCSSHLKTMCCADVVEEDPEAEAKAESDNINAAATRGDTSSVTSDADRSSYKEAIATSPNALKLNGA
ncbi:PH and SEC7 domain-containing protein 3 [Toxocara canis]|uniref:PH and SEC7 domain-containing protein 3 n=2 Tax=Toxocara canis TaxID=6265 RepID=A0A0B2VX09_TOXCA|nr:PH and SEC7 domain-containing protein 3 [Toxocara canis]VDM43432.1 unnamed protein product [Toxocara canis]